MIASGVAQSEIFAVTQRHHWAGRLWEVERAYRSIPSADPNHTAAPHNPGVLAHEAGRTSDAISPITEALTPAPDDFGIRCNLSETYLAQGNLAEAEVHARLGLALRLDMSEAWVNLGAALRMQDRGEEVDMPFRRALEVRPNFKLALTALLPDDKSPRPGRQLFLADRAQMRRGMCVEALGQLHEALHLKPRSEVEVDLGPIYHAVAARPFRQPLIFDGVTFLPGRAGPLPRGRAADCEAAQTHCDCSGST